MTDAGTVTMSAKELNRLEVLGRVIERRWTQRQAAEQLGLSERQVRRLYTMMGAGRADAFAGSFPSPASRPAQEAPCARPRFGSRSSS